MDGGSSAVGGSILGASVRRAEDPRFIGGEGRYVDDVRFEGEVWMVPVRSQVPHGTIVALDTDRAVDMPGVIGVFGPQDLEGTMPADFSGQPEATLLDLITGDTVRFVGDIVAVVVAESPRQAVDAADLVWASIDPLPAVATPDEAIAEGAPLLFPEYGSNVIWRFDLEAPDALEGADMIVSVDVVHQRVAAVPLETNNAVAVPTEDGGLDILMGSQVVHGARNVFSSVLGLEQDRIRVRVADMGGGFGAKVYTYREQALCGLLALRLGRPVRWSESRSENMVGMTHGRAQTHRIEVGATSDGRIVGARFHVVQDCGGYPVFGTFIPAVTSMVASGPYDIPKIDYRSMSVVTNTTPVHAYRGAGRPEAAVSLERAVDTLAGELGMDPAEVRRINFRDPAGFPWITAIGERYDSGNYSEALELALNTVGYTGLRAEQARRRASSERFQLGIGLATYVEVSAPAGVREDWGAVEVHADGTATAFSGALSHGQSHETTFPQLVSRVLGIPLERIALVQADTDSIPRGGGTMGSRSLQIAGSAIHRSSEGVLDKARRLVAHRSEAALEDVELLDNGTVGVRGVPDSGLTWSEIAALASDPANLPDGMGPGMKVEDDYTQEHSSVPFGTHVSVVEVDTETGAIRVLRHVAVDDAGTILNHMVLDGQIHGGIAQGIGQALFEQVRYDENANPLTGNLTSYLVPTAVTLPDFDLRHTLTPSTSNALGVKGVGEAGTVGSTPAVYGAALDAVAHLGVGALQMPITPDRLWSAIAAAKSE